MTGKLFNWWESFGVKFMSGIVTPVGVITMVAMYSADRAENKALQFDSMALKVMTQEHINKAPSDIDAYLAFIEVDSIRKAQKQKELEYENMKKIVDTMSDQMKVNTAILKQVKKNQDKMMKNQTNNNKIPW